MSEIENNRIQQDAELDLSQEGFSLDELVKQERHKGEELEKHWSAQIKEIQAGLFEYLGVSSTDGLKEKMEDIKQFPLGFFFPTYFGGHETTIQAEAGLANARCVITDDSGCVGERPLNVESIINKVVNSRKTKNVVGIMWRSSLVNQYSMDLEHNGVWIDDGIKGLGIGYGLYRLNEAVFGKQKTEVASKLSLLKLYLKLGFIPSAVVNPISGEKLSRIEVGEVIKDCIKSGEEDIPLPIYLERGKQ